MAVFGRKRRSARAADAQDRDLDRSDEADLEYDDADDAGEAGEAGDAGDAGEADTADRADEADEANGAEDQPGTHGPYDRDQVPGLQGRLDLGSLWLTAAPGMQVRLDMDPQSGEVTSVTAMLGQSSIQLQAFAAPKSEGIWDEIRAEIAQSVTGQGGTAEEADGPHGIELLTRIPARGPDGRTVHQQARFIGVDGPRWFLRGVITGPAALDAAQLPPLLFVLATAVVVRGVEARAPRELLPLQLPQELLEPGDGAAFDPADGPDGPDGADGPDIEDFRPFERGPEITEIR